MSQQRIVLTWDGSLSKEFAGLTTYPVVIASQRGRLRFGINELLGGLKKQGKKPDPQALELVLVALAVWLADTRLSRQQFSEDNWTRNIEIVIPVRNPGLWNGCTSLLNRVLGALSGDIWSVTFYQATPQLIAYVDTACANTVVSAEAPAVALFSGGLDSFTGAIDALAREEVRPVFVSQTDGGNSSTVNELAELLQQDDGHAIDLFRWAVSSQATDLGSGFSGGGELTMRARSFLFFAASVLVATAFGSNRVVVPENGFISLNVPLDPWRLGALTTRTTHPFVIGRFNELLVTLGLEVQLENPFQALTKGEMLAQCADQKLLWAGLATTVSCSKPRYVRRYRSQFGTSHCGTCWPCLIRRAAVLRAFPTVDDPNSYVREDLSHLSTEPGAAGHVVRSIQYGLNMLRQSDDQLRWVLSSVAPLRDVEIEVPQLIGCVRRGLIEVARVIGLPIPK